MDTFKLLFACVYLLVDMTYVFISKDYYAKAIGVTFPSGRELAMAAAWGCMVVGWFFFVAPTALSWSSKGHGSWIAGALAGALYGLAVIGTYNFTNMGVFTQWKGRFVVRDICWGVTWASVLTALYAGFAYRHQERIQPATRR